MIINHPLLGPRDSSEFVYLGDACLLNRPAWVGERIEGEDADQAKTVEAATNEALRQYHDYVHIRQNNAGEHKELWFHEQGDRSWLVVTRDTITHEIYKVELAKDVAKALAEESNAESNQ